MMRYLRRPTSRDLFGILLGLLCLVSAADAQPRVISPTGQWVTDRADVLSSSEERALTATLQAYEDSTSTQIVVVTIPTLDGADIASYATALGEEWGVGQKETDNGAVILLAREERRVFIATGFGLEGAVPDIIAGRIVRNIMIPAFREGDYYAGLSGAVDAIISAASGEYEAADVAEGSARDEGGVDAATLFVLLIIGYFVISSLRRRSGGGGSGGARRGRRGGMGPIIIWGGGGRGGGGFGGGGFGGGGFGGGGGSFGGGGAGGSW